MVAKTILAALAAVGTFCPTMSAKEHNGDRQNYTVLVNKSGELYRSDTGDKMLYYGTNYTAPFAHAYRALGYLGVDRKEAINRDVYHMARLGLNAFRLHLWDVELSDAEGNLQQNDHLDLLDFLIAELEKRGIDIVLTAQTDFGNGYPERNIDTGAFAYDFDKCDIHDNPKAQKIQENYLKQLAEHVNPYTGLSYGKDRAIIAMEVNNEPCHSGNSKQVTNYINRMVKALRKGGFDKPILYNVSHNPDVTDGYYKADIQGTTFQWYPTGLVAGRQRHGNYLPTVDEYHIPWEKTMPGYADKARFIYEFDPGDVLNSNLYPAIVRTLRGKGFQWITQFAYDPTDMARFNTEYQTHFLNLAYTPAKALSMMIAAKAMQDIPEGAYYGKYPENKQFGYVTLYDTDHSSLYNSPSSYIHTAPSATPPVNPDSLTELAGVGSNPLVKYHGTGVWFLDRLDDSVWRLEVMPDVVLTEDPFKKPSLNREVGEIINATHPMEIDLPSLGESYLITPLSGQESKRAENKKFNVSEGVYLLSAQPLEPGKWTAETAFKNMKLGEFVAPEAKKSEAKPKVFDVYTPLALVSDSMKIDASAVYADSLVVYPGDVNFWRNDNKLYGMEKAGEDRPYSWQASVPTPDHIGKYTYRIVAYNGDKPVTYPGAINGTPLDWDFPDDAPSYSVDIINDTAPLPLIVPGREDVFVEAGSIPDAQGAWLQTVESNYSAPAYYRLNFTPTQTDTHAIIRADLSRLIPHDPNITNRKNLHLILAAEPKGVETVEVGVENNRGVSFTAAIPVKEFRKNPNGTFEVSIPLAELKKSKTLLMPAAYPSFTARSYDG
ncbi:MAG: cellulase family glycosylhydrolase, partial [Lachnospiraceae bacterium]|nr:cellulase family glycosylhydrolase [Lachnospiraceae bacterium]